MDTRICKNEVIQRKFKKAEETINFLTEEKFLAEKIIKILIIEKSESEETNNTLSWEYKLKVETLESEVAKLREELSKKEQL